MRNQAIRLFMERHFTDARLAALLAHAEDGKLSFFSCCCFIGTATATHPLRSRSRLIELGATLSPRGVPACMMPAHYGQASEMIGADEAEDEFFFLGETEEERRKAIIPIIRKEMKRREHVRQQQEDVKTRGHHGAVDTPLEPVA